MTEENQWVAVRCCCTPTKVLGFISMRRENVKAGYCFRLPVRGVHMAKICHLREMAMGRYAQEIAIYSEDRPIEFWRSVSGFIEAGEPSVGDFGFDRLGQGFTGLDFPGTPNRTLGL